jgi:phage gp16-like protein
MGIDKKEIAVIHIAKTQLGISEEDYRAILKQQCGVESSKQLDKRGLATLMDYFAKLGFKSTARARRFGQRAGMATPGQVTLMRKLWEEYTGVVSGDQEMGKWLHRHFKISALRFVSSEKAPKVIHALRHMAAQRRSA